MTSVSFIVSLEFLRYKYNNEPYVDLRVSNINLILRLNFQQLV